MKKGFKNNQRRKQLNRQHHKMSARRLSHFAQSLIIISEPHPINLITR